MESAIAVILHNLAWWSLGFLAGWCACRLVRRATQFATAPGGLMHSRDPHRSLVAALTTLVIAALVALVVAAAERFGNSGPLQDLWNTCRHLNYPLGVLVACGVIYRLVLMVWDRPRWRDPAGVHTLLWFVYIAANLIAAAMTSHHYELAGVDATWVSGLRTLLMSGAVVLTVWWPHPREYTPIEESR